MGGQGFSPRFCPEGPVVGRALMTRDSWRALIVKKPEEAMEILVAYDAAGTLRGAAALAGCDHKTVARLVAARDAAGGGLPVRARNRPLIDPFAEKIDELVDRSHARIRADKTHQVLVAMGYEGSYRTTRRAVAEAKRRWQQKHGRRTRPWIPQPGLWLQWDYGDGPVIAGTRGVLFCAYRARTHSHRSLRAAAAAAWFGPRRGVSDDMSPGRRPHPRQASSRAARSALQDRDDAEAAGTDPRRDVRGWGFC